MDNPASESSAPLDIHSGAEAFANFDFDNEGEAAPTDETPETAAERILKDEALEKEPVVPKEGEPAAADTITIQVDGKDVSLTKEELAEHYKNGLRQADYTRKTMDVAEARKTAEVETNKARQERHELAQQLHNYTVQVDGALQEQSKIDWQQLLATDPVAYLEQQRIFQERQANLNVARQRLQGLNQQHQAEQAEAQRNYLSSQQQELLAKLPEWKDPAKAASDMAAVSKYLAEQGFSGEEIKSVADHRNVLAYRKAMLYDALLARASIATKKVAALPPKVERPGTASNTGKPDGRTEAMKRLSKTGSINDAAAAFSTYFD